MLQYPICTRPRVEWSPPPAENFKVNFDGVTFKEIHKARFSVVIWNSLGQPIASLSELVNLPYSSDIVEAMAASRAIYFSQEIGLNSFILEGDFEAMIKCLRSDDDSFLLLVISWQQLKRPQRPIVVFHFPIFVDLVTLLLTT